MADLKYVYEIQDSECIGNSLSKINGNFARLNNATVLLDSFRDNARNLSVTNQGALLMSLNGTLTSARVGVDYIKGTSEIGTGLIKTIDGTLSKAVSGTDYYVPRSILQAMNTTIFGTLSTTGTVQMGATTINGNLLTNGRIIGGIAGATTQNENNSRIAGDLKVDGNLYANQTLNNSDFRLKTNIELIEYPLEKLNQLRGVMFDWKQGLVHDIGVIAQEVESVIPEAIESIWDEEKQMNSKYVAYTKLIPLLIESVKALKAEVDYLRSRVDQS